MTLATTEAKNQAESTPSSGGSKLWGGRFSAATDPVMERFNASIGYDKRLAAEDVTGSKAYAKAIHGKNLISDRELSELLKGLDLVLDEWSNETFHVIHSDEDIHTANERRLTELIGSEIAGKLHTGRSRNDQVTVDMRLWLKKELKQILRLIVKVIEVHVSRAESELHILLPGFTHLQRAQAIRWSHWLLSYCSAWKRDYIRFEQVLDVVDTLTLGCG